MQETFFLFGALISGFVYFSGLVSHTIKEKLGISGALTSTLFGLLIRAIFNRDANFLHSFGFMKELSRVVVSLQVVAVGMYVPQSYVRREWISLAVILGPFMLVTFAVSALGSYLLLNTGVRVSLVIGACVTPTDPVLAATIMKGRFASKHVPVHIRNLLTVESGANDGLGSVLLAISVLFGDSAWKHKLVRIFLVDILLALVIGLGLGFTCRKLQSLCMRKNMVDKEAFLGSMICLAFFVTSLCALFQTADILACFVCGLFFSWDKTFVEEIKDSHLLEVIDMLVNHVFFVLFGYLLPLNEFQRRDVVYSMCVLFLRRLPLFVLLKKFVPQLKTTKEAVFAGYFGPVGVGALLFGYHGLHLLGNEAGTERLMAILQCVTLSSVVVHGVVGFVLTRIIGKEKGYDPDESEYDTPSNCLIDESTESSY